VGIGSVSATAVRFQARRSFPYLRRATYWLGTAIASVVLAAVLGTLGARLLGYQPYVMYGGSMGSTASLGSVAFIENVPTGSLKVGDVVVFQPPSSREPLMHRIISIEEVNGQRVFGTKGDANQSPDPWNLTINGEGGRLVYVVPYIGYLFWFFQTRLAWAIVVFPIAAYLGLIALRRIWAPAARRDNPNTQTL
jgi:signal peptidase